MVEVYSGGKSGGEVLNFFVVGGMVVFEIVSRVFCVVFELSRRW